jgi:hypothetical protein
LDLDIKKLSFYIQILEKISNFCDKNFTKLEELGDDNSLGKALDKLEEALRIDPNNGFVKNKIGNLRSLRKNFSTTHASFRSSRARRTCW